MTVYVDNFRARARVGTLTARWSHLIADSREELHEFARKLGLKREWFQDPVVNGKPKAAPGSRAAENWHYDVTDSMRRKALELGAQPVHWRHLHEVIASRSVSPTGSLVSDTRDVGVLRYRRARPIAPAGPSSSRPRWGERSRMKMSQTQRLYPLEPPACSSLCGEGLAWAAPSPGNERTMPRENRALTRAARRRARDKNVPYQQAHEDVQAIRQVMVEDDVTWEEAEAVVDDPANQVLCEKCGWTNGMVCPECPGCGCYNRRCSGWRHVEYMSDDELAEMREDERCDECGADTSMGSYDVCTCG